MVFVEAVIGPEELDSPWAGPVTKFCYVPPEMRFEIHFGDAGGSKSFYSRLIS